MIRVPKTDLVKVLAALRNEDASGITLESILSKHEIALSDPAHAVTESQVQNPVNSFEFDLLAADKIFHLNHIRTLCIDYRLRFLDLRFFKPELPKEALQAIQNLENEHNTRLDALKIVAPSRLFKLKDRDDPLLFVPLGNDYYYLVHKWGNDLHPLRKVLVWPFKSLPNLIGVLLIVSYFLTAIIPSGLFSKQDQTAEFWILYFFVFKMIAAVALFYGFALGKNFNPAIWDSKYFNA
ncbi:MAG: hypothetical protein RLZZ241_154 [Bacteroidota bacterium]|jgi:hypothetical protein